MTGTFVRLRWTSRPEPLHPAAVVGEGAVVAELAAATAAGLERGAALLAAAGPGWLLVLGSADDLPWADDAVYLGYDFGLLLPTTQEPFPGAAFLASAIAPAPLRAVLPGRLLTAPLPARAPDPAQLAALP